MSTRVARLFPFQGQWTEAEYLTLPETNHIVELSNGRLVVPDLPTPAHQYAVGELFVALRLFVRAHDGGSVAIAPLKVRLGPDKFREPDIVFMAKAHAERRGSEFWGVPDLAVEVVSPRKERSSGTERTDRVVKFKEYAQAGVSEYWLVDPKTRTVEVYALTDSAYRRHGRWETGQTATSALLQGFQVPVSSLFED